MIQLYKWSMVAKVGESENVRIQILTLRISPTVTLKIKHNQYILKSFLFLLAQIELDEVYLLQFISFQLKKIHFYWKPF
jgi:hypothetical protein